MRFFMGAKAMTNIFSRIKNELASWFATSRFLLALDRYGLNFYHGFDQDPTREDVDKA